MKTKTMKKLEVTKHTAVLLTKTIAAGVVQRVVEEKTDNILVNVGVSTVLALGVTRATFKWMANCARSMDRIDNEVEVIEGE